MAVEAAGCNEAGRRTSRKEEVVAVKKTHALFRESPPSRRQSHKEATTCPTSASGLQGLEAVPMHLLTCQSVHGGLGEGQRWEVGGGSEGGQGKEKGSRQDSAPRRSAQAQWPLRQEGAATPRSEWWHRWASQKLWCPGHHRPQPEFLHRPAPWPPALA
jgi:hypothetical protein